METLSPGFLRRPPQPSFLRFFHKTYLKNKYGGVYYLKNYFLKHIHNSTPKTQTEERKK